jgi:Flp pilus assembly protein TadB
LLAWQPPRHRRDPSTGPTQFILTGSVAAERKLFRMNEQHTESRTPTGGRMQSFGRHALAALVLLVCAWILLHLLFHVVIVVATIIAVVVAIIGAVWAVRVLF